MINANTYGSQIMDALFNTSAKTANNTVAFPTTPYLALFTKVPTSDGTGYEEPSSDEYVRILLSSKGATQKNLLTTATVEAGTGDDSDKLVASVTNQELIFFPEAETSGWGEVYGFGVFTSSVKNEGTPYFWGELTNSVTIDQGEIPIFRIGDFKVTLA